LVDVEHAEIREVRDLFIRERAIFRDRVPFLKALPAAASRGVLGVENHVLRLWRLPPVVGVFLAHVFPDSVLRRRPEPRPAFLPGVLEGFLVDLRMPEVVPDHFLFQHADGVRGVRKILFLDTLPINEFRAASAARPPLVSGFHLPSRPEAVESLIAAARSTFDVEGLKHWPLLPGCRRHCLVTPR
jgi:hypothetical protein